MSNRRPLRATEAHRAHNDGCPRPDKLGYLRRHEAKRIARQLNLHLKKQESKLSVYLCECGLFHLGNRLGGEARELHGKRH